MSLFEGCVFWYDFESVSTTIPIQNITILGAPSLVATVDRDGISRNKYDITNSNTQYFDSTTSWSTSGVHSGIMWINMDTINAGNSFCHCGGSDILKATSATVLGSAMATPTLYVNGVAATTISTGSWIMIAATSATSSLTGRVYINNGSAYGHVGTYGECFYFNKELSAAEIKAFYDLTSKKYIYPYQRGERWCE